MPREQKRVIYLDGHVDTVKPLREQWLANTGGLHPHHGLVDAAKLKRDWLRQELGWLPPDDEWNQLIFGRGSADQLGGVLSQIMGSRILVELERRRPAAPVYMLRGRPGKLAKRWNLLVPEALIQEEWTGLG